MRVRPAVTLVFVILIAILIGVSSPPPMASARFDQATSAATVSATQAATAAPVCPNTIKTALDAASKECASTGRNQACYGNTAIQAKPQPGVTDFTFNAPGQIVPLSSLQNIQLSALDPATNTWGVAVLRVQANLPDTAPGQNVTMLLFGDVQLENAVTNPTTTLEATAANAISVRQKPVNASSVVGKLAANSTVTVTGRVKDSSWLRVNLAGTNGKIITGWIPATAATVKSSDNIGSLDVIDPTAPVYGPLQAFYFRTGVGEPGCQDAPANGILIQSPKQSIRVNLTINDVQINLGSTVFIRAQPNSNMVIATLDGVARVSAHGVTQLALAGQQLEVPMDANLSAASAPETPDPYDTGPLQGLPLTLLPNPITLIPPRNPPGAAPTPTRIPGVTLPRPPGP